MGKKHIYISLLFYLLFCNLKFNSAQNVQNSYGGYIHVLRLDTTANFQNHIVQFNYIVYFPVGEITPDSITTMLMGEKTSWKKGKLIESCDGIIAQNYTTDYYRHWFGIYLYDAFFDYDSIQFIGQNLDTNLFYINGKNYKFHLQNRYSPNNYTRIDNNTPEFKNIPLITIERNASTTVNFIEKDIENDPLSVSSYLLLPDWMKINPSTGDLAINTFGIDTGYYSYFVRIEEGFNQINPYQKKSETFYNFTIHIVDEHVPYFKLNNQIALDSMTIPYIHASSTEKTLNFNCSFISPKGINGYQVTLQSILPYLQSPKLITEKINDTLLKLSVEINLDTTVTRIFENLPHSLSIIVNSTDSNGSCKNNMMSFYVTREPITGIKEAFKLNESNFYFFPNPVSNELTIELLDGAWGKINWEIYDIQGVLIKNFESQNSSMYYKMDLSDLTSGVYFLKQQHEGISGYSKFIKN